MTENEEKTIKIKLKMKNDASSLAFFCFRLNALLEEHQQRHQNSRSVFFLMERKSLSGTPSSGEGVRLPLDAKPFLGNRIKFRVKLNSPG